MEQTNTQNFYQRAMHYGTLLGLVWSVMYVLIFKSIASPMLMSIALALYIGSPFIAARYAKSFRDKECGGVIKFPQAWTFLFCIYFCATLLSTLSNYIYLNFFDQGSFLLNAYNGLEEAIAIPGLEEGAKEQLKATQELMQQFTTNGIVWYLFSNNVMSSLTVPPIIALFIRKTY